MTPYIAAPDFDRFPLSEEDHAVAAAHGLELRPVEGNSVAEFLRVAPDAVGTLVWAGQYGTEFLDALPQLRVLARCGAGYDNIDVLAAQERGVAVTYCPGFFDDSVAEHVIASVFALARKITQSDRAIREGGWPSVRELTPMLRIEGLAIGIVGLGRIARKVVDLALALRMRVLAFDPYLLDADLPAGVTRVATLDQLLAESDVVSLHAPLTPETTGMIGPRQIAAMKRTAFLVNTGRGPLVDGVALASALEAGVIAGAALDVFDPEPIPVDHPIITAPNTVLTPHSSAFDGDALAAVRRSALADAIAVLEGRAPRHPVDLERTIA